MLIGGGSAYGISQLITPIYRASTTLLVNQTQTPGKIAYNDILTSERHTKTYLELITKRPAPRTPAGCVRLLPSVGVTSGFHRR